VKNQLRIKVFKGLFYVIALGVISSYMAVSASSDKISPIVDIQNLPVCDIDTLKD